MSGKTTGSLASLVGLDVEVRTAGGSPIRGRLLGVDGEWIHVERHGNGRAAFVRVAEVVAVVDEASVARRVLETEAAP